MPQISQETARDFMEAHETLLSRIAEALCDAAIEAADTNEQNLLFSRAEWLEQVLEALRETSAGNPSQTTQNMLNNAHDAFFAAMIAANDLSLPGDEVTIAQYLEECAKALGWEEFDLPPVAPRPEEVITAASGEKIRYIGGNAGVVLDCLESLSNQPGMKRAARNELKNLWTKLYNIHNALNLFVHNRSIEGAHRIAIDLAPQTLGRIRAWFSYYGADYHDALIALEGYAEDLQGIRLIGDLQIPIERDIKEFIGGSRGAYSGRLVDEMPTVPVLHGQVGQTFAARESNRRGGSLKGMTGKDAKRFLGAFEGHYADIIGHFYTFSMFVQNESARETFNAACKEFRNLHHALRQLAKQNEQKSADVGRIGTTLNTAGRTLGRLQAWFENPAVAARARSANAGPTLLKLREYMAGLELDDVYVPTQAVSDILAGKRTGQQRGGEARY